jgi:ligand-binding sensor domain-containing protein
VNIFEDREGYLWITNLSTGLDRFDPETETFRNFSHDPDDPGSISSNDIFYVTQDTKGTVWVCAGNALNRFVSSEDNATKRDYFEKYINPLPSDLIRCVFETREGRLFIFSNELYYFDATNKRIVNTGVALENTAITSVVKDSDDNVLIGTILNGIIRLDYNSTTKTYQR